LPDNQTKAILERQEGQISKEKALMKYSVPFDFWEGKIEIG